MEEQIEKYSYFKTLGKYIYSNLFYFIINFVLTFLITIIGYSIAPFFRTLPLYINIIACIIEAILIVLSIYISFKMNKNVSQIDKKYLSSFTVFFIYLFVDAFILSMILFIWFKLQPGFWYLTGGFASVVVLTIYWLLTMVIFLKEEFKRF